jgi:hypothetical protein
MKRFLFLLLLTYSFTVISQSLTKRVLFLGNSYTNRNNLPNLLVNVSLSTGDSVFVESNTPGGYTLQGHSTNSNSLNRIAQGNWDYVVLQEQSQRPSFPDAQVQANVYPYAKRLDSLINLANPCTETVFYMTWGRKNGDAGNCPFFPPLCTYQGMDSLLNLRYSYMANINDALVSPVGAVWNYIRSTYPNIELYTADESHPSLAGSYAAACTFYATILRRDPTLITFNASLPALEAVQIKSAVKLMVYDSLANWNVGKYDPSAAFTTTQNAFKFDFRSDSSSLVHHFWNFGDGITDTVPNPSHTYSALGMYTVSHVVTKCNRIDSTNEVISILHLGNSDADKLTNVIKVFPNPVKDILTIESEFPIFNFRLIAPNGKVVLNQPILEKSKTFSLNVQGVVSGFYYLELIGSDNHRLTRKIIIE